MRPLKTSQNVRELTLSLGRLFSSEMTLDWDWSGPNTMGDLPTVSPGVGGTLQEIQEVLRHH